MSLKLTAPLAAVLALSACAPRPPGLQASDPRNDGIAKVCTPTNPDMSKPGRNDLCPCGSGKKYKNCCMNKVE